MMCNFGRRAPPTNYFIYSSVNKLNLSKPTYCMLTLIPLYVGQSLVSMVSPQSGFDLLLVAMDILVKIPLGFPPKLKTEVAKMVG